MLKLLTKYSDVIASYKISRFEHLGIKGRYKGDATLFQVIISHARIARNSI